MPTISSDSPCQAFIVYENSQRISRGDERINTQVELESVNQQRLVEIILANHSLVHFHLLQVLRQPNPATLRALIGLDDESLIFVLSTVLDCITEAVGWKQN